MSPSLNLARRWSLGGRPLFRGLQQCDEGLLLLSLFFGAVTERTIPALHVIVSRLILTSSSCSFGRLAWTSKA